MNEWRKISVQYFLLLTFFLPTSIVVYLKYCYAMLGFGYCFLISAGYT